MKAGLKRAVMRGREERAKRAEGVARTGRVWSPQQLRVFEALERAKPGEAFAVVARAGTGKTTTIEEAIRRIGERGKGVRILASAFNKGTAEELGRRLAGVAECRTWHSIGFGMVHGQWGRGVGVDGGADWERIRRIAGVGMAQERTAAIKAVVGRLKNEARGGKRDEGIGEAIEVMVEELGVERLVGARERDVVRAVLGEREPIEVRGKKVISFDDMLWLPLVAELPPVERFDWVFVDESQDLNEAQWGLAEQVVEERGHMVVVGDERQAIYAFRGAASGRMGRWIAAMGATVLPLTVTYRCPKRVVEEARQLVRDFEAAEGAREGSVERRGGGVEEIIAKAHPGEAVLSRMNVPLVTVTLGLWKRGVRASILGRDLGERVRKVMGDAWAGVAEGAGKGVLVEAILRWKERIIGQALALPPGPQREKAIRKAGEAGEFSAILRAVVEAGADGETRAQIDARLARLWSDTGEGGAGVTLATVHRAKGREWGTVWLEEESFIRCRGRAATVVEEEEERNIWYVAVTRAQERLVVVEGKGGGSGGGCG